MAIELQRSTAKSSKVDDFCAVLGSSPSFSSYSSTRLREIAAKVGTEMRDLVGTERFGIGIANNGKVFHSNYEEQKSRKLIDCSNGDQSLPSITTTTTDDREKESVEEEAESDATTDDDFEFSCVCSRHEVLTISADEIFANGQIRPIYPIFDRDLVSINKDLIKYKKLGSSTSNSNSKSSSTKARNPLRKLFNEERMSSSWSSSDFDDLESIPRETYCVWVPKTSSDHQKEHSSDRCKKSSSTGTATRWKLRDLISRSNSEGKDSIVFLARSTSCPKSKNSREDQSHEQLQSTRNNTAKVMGKVAGKASSGRNPVVSAHETLYVRNRTSKEIARRQSYLPYKREIVGFFANVNGFGKHFGPF